MMSETSRSLVPDMLSHAQGHVPVQTREAMLKSISSTASARDEEEAVTLLARYHADKHHFPFVITPPELSNLDGRQQRPFLWRAIKMAGVWREENRHFQLGRKLLRDLTGVVLSGSNRSLDTIQGLLVLVAWLELPRYLSFCMWSVTNKCYAGITGSLTKLN